MKGFSLEQIKKKFFLKGESPTLMMIRLPSPDIEKMPRSLIFIKLITVSPASNAINDQGFSALKMLGTAIHISAYVHVSVCIYVRVFVLVCV